MKKFNGFTKWLTVGALTLAISIPAGAASAADTAGSSNGTTVQYKVFYAGVGDYGDWGAWLQQYFQTHYPVKTQPTVEQPTAQPKPQQPTVQQPTTQPKPQQPTTTKPSTPASNAGTANQAADSSSYAAQVVTLVNQERAKAGLSPLSSHAELANMAMVKAKDMKNNNYFDHNSPTYGSPFDMMKSFGISYRYAGENIAMGQRTPQEVMNAWMNSQGHKANILSSNFTSIGVAYYNGAWVQEFIG